MAPSDPATARAARWLEEHGDALYGFALGRVRSPHIAEDLVQETLLAALKAHDRFTGSASERTWLIGILKHKLLDHLRRAVRQRPLSELQGTEAADLFDQRGSWSVRVSSWNADPHAILENSEFRKVLASCLDKLPGRLAQIFMLREMDGIGSDQLCQDLGISPTNLWTMLHRARLRLRRCLSDNWFESKGP